MNVASECMSEILTFFFTRKFCGHFDSVKPEIFNPFISVL